MRLHDRSRAFIWGPPGTGKTTTLACLVAQYLVQYPYSHVLLLSTTNTAVDQLLVVIDRTLDDLGITTDSPEELRRKCKRIGTRFNATMYRGREHLLPVIDESVVSELAAVEAQRPDPRNAEKYNEWRRRIDELRGRLREQYEQELREARLAAMTVASATRYYSLLEQIRFDLAVFDEASQIGMAAALMLAPLGKSTVFAGDPKQIAPIVMSEDERAKDWLGTSIFSKMRENGGETVMLDEQNRMAPPIGQLVSQAFYEGKLRLADDAYSSPEWWNDRQLPDGQRHVEIHRITGEGKSDGHSSFRSNSADLIAKLVKDATSTLDSNDILVITPFRRQRQYIEKRLRKRGIAEVRVQTVHRAQGAEYHTVFFDPVRGASQFLGDENGMRLINVAISRSTAS